MISKIEYYNFPEEILSQGNNFLKTDSSQIDTSIPKKFLEERQNIFFRNQATGDIVFLNRTLVDQRLDLKIDSPKEAREEEGKYY